MESNTKQLMKHFASVLRNRALDKPEKTTASKLAVGYFNRKELIEILKKRFNGSIPKEYNLMEMENEQLFNLIGDQMYLISFMSEKWSREIPKPTTKNKVPPIANKKSTSDGLKK